MSYSQPLINQPRILFFSIGVGLLLGAFYVVIQGLFRLLGEGKLSYYLADFIFVAVFTLVSFFFMVIYNDGRVRLHLIAGEGAGFLLFYFSVGRYAYKAVARLSFIVRALFRPYAFIFNSFINGMKELVTKAVKKLSSLTKRNNEAEQTKKRFKNFNLFDKIHLKNQDKSV